MDQGTQEITDEIIQQAIEKATQRPAPESVGVGNHAIVFYCKDCQAIVPAEKKGKGLKFVCPKCSRDNIAIGTQKSIENYYHLNK